MKERPILFSGPMIRALLDGRKTQTRRIVKPQPTEQVYQIYHSANFAPSDPLDQDVPDFAREIHCPYGAPGDQLWVRETWAEDGIGYTYRATNETWPHHWAPSIFMPRAASRIQLEIVDVRVERVQDITTADACAEGVPGCRDDLSNVHAVEFFKALWDQINGARPGYSWANNPWVWCLTFKRLTP